MTGDNAFQTPDPKALVRVIIARWWLVLVPMLIGGSAGWLTTAKAVNVRLSRVYNATTIMVTTGQTESLERLQFLTKVGEVPKRVAKELGRPSPLELVAKVTLAIDKTVGSLQMTATSNDKNEAALIANAFAKGLIDHLNAERRAAYQRQVDDATKDLQSLASEVRALDQKITGATTAANELLRAQRDAKVRRYSIMYEQVQYLQSTPPAGAGLTVLQEAVPFPVETAAKKPEDPVRKAGMGVAGGMLAGLGLALGVEQFNRRVRSRDDARSGFGLPVLAEVPRARSPLKQLPVATHSLSRTAAAYRFLLGALAVDASPNGGHTRGSRARVVLVTSPGDGEGNTVVAANLAATFVEAGLRTVILSADLRKSKLHKLLSTAEHPGLLDVLEGRSSLADALHSSARVEGLSVVPGGGKASNPATMLAGDETRSVIAQLQEECDVLVIDTTPLLTANDAAAVLKHVDHVVVVARNGRTTLAAANRAGEFLRQARARVAGVVLFGSRGTGGGSLDGGGFGAFTPPPPPLPQRANGKRTRAPREHREEEPAHTEEAP
jgi:capsular exopolysaccharide synthesis family protein